MKPNPFIRSSFLTFAVLAVIVCPFDSFAQMYAGGSGTIGDPYQIATPVHLHNVSENLSSHFIQIADIDLDVSPYNEGYGWIPIGNSATKFSGTYDGQGYTISNMYMDRTNNDYCGLFGYTTTTAEIKNACVKNMDATAKLYVGGIAGYNEGLISCCYTTGKIEGTHTVGGIAGINNGISSNTGTISNSYSLAYVRATSTTGRAGGVAGNNYFGTITNCYASGGVSVPTSKGGGLVGEATSATVNNSFWNTETSAQMSSLGGTGITIQQMRTASTFSSVGWDFTDVWAINDGTCYPYLQSVVQTPPPNPSPFIITTIQDLDSIRNFLHGHFQLGANLDFNSDASYAQISGWEAVKTAMTTGSGFDPIGTVAGKFIGLFDGNGYTITNLFIDRSGTDNVGLFGYVGGAGKIRNTGVEDADITARNYAGVFAGYNEGTISTSYSNGYLTANQYIGGITGRNDKSSSATKTGLVENCYSQTYITAIAAASRAGGLIGDNYYGTISNCYCTGGILALGDCGGLIGNATNGMVNNSFWNSETSAQLSSLAGTPATMEEMKTASTFSGAGWDMTTIWAITNGSTYPWLQASVQSPAPGPDPIIITTIQDLDAVRNLRQGHYQLGNDLDFNDNSSYASVTGWEAYKTSVTSGEGFMPIGTDVAPFTGLFDGNGHAIKNLFINRPATNYVGLFGFIGGAGEVRRTGVEDASVTGYQYVGAVSGMNEGIISLSYANGNVSGYTRVGGVAGQINGISASRVGLIINSYCQATAVSTNIRVGGITGYNYYGTLRNCYSTGGVSGSSTQGGLVGGSSTANVDSSFWNIESSGQNTSAGGGTGLLTNQMMEQETFTDALWDFSGTWDIDEGTSFPWLIANEQDPHPVPTPIGIYNIQDLDSIRFMLYGHFRLMKDLDFNSDTSYEQVTGWEAYKAAMTSGDGFVPVGTNLTPFTGLFDGNGHTIRNLYINRNSTDYVGLIGYYQGASSITKLALEDVNITGRDHVGGVVGYNSGTISCCYTTGEVTGNSGIGGIAGTCFGLTAGSAGLVSNCYSMAYLSGAQRVGGIAGYLYAGDVLNCYAAGGVWGGSSTGGVTGGVSTSNLVTSSFYDIESTSQNTDPGGAIGRATWQMKVESEFTAAGWDFVNTWDIVNDTTYPWLRYFPQTTVKQPQCTEIHTIQDLDNMRNFLQGHYRLMTDLDFEDDNSYAHESGWEAYKTSMISGSGFEPVGNATTPFTGWFDGNGHKISNLYINRPTSDHVGLFGVFAGYGSIKNLVLLSVDVTGQNYTGAFAGTNSGIITSCYVTGSVTGTSEAGGLAGRNDGVTATKAGLIRNCYSHAHVTGSDRQGGATGYNYYGTVENCFTTGVISGGGTSGGLIGTQSGGSVINSYWDTETSGKAASSGGLGRTTVQMTYPYDTNTFLGWNFINIWAEDDDFTKNSGYPFLGYPLVYSSPNMTVSTGQSSCYDGVNTVTVAGGGTAVIVKSGGTLDVVADQRVLILDGTMIRSGAHFHAWIEPGGGHCGESQAKMTEAGLEDAVSGIMLEELQTGAIARIYPNPGTGLYTLEFLNGDPVRLVSVEICTMTGILTGRYELPGTGTYRLDLSGEASGLYFVRVMDLDQVQVIKVIKQ